MDKTIAGQAARSRGWLASTPPDFQDRVIARSDLIAIAAGQSIYNAGDETGGVFGLIAGRIEIHLLNLGNSATLAHIGQPGIWVGDLAAVLGQPRLMSIVASEPSTLLRLSRAELNRIVAETPGAWMHVSAMLAQNFARAIETIEYLRCPDPTRRVAAMLASMIGNRAPAPIHASQFELAEMAHLGRTNVQRALIDLSRRGLIRRGYAAIEVIDLKRLVLFAQTPGDDE